MHQALFWALYKKKTIKSLQWSSKVGDIIISNLQMRKKGNISLQLQRSSVAMSAFKPKHSASRIHTLDNFSIVYTLFLHKIFLICILKYPM